MSIRYTFTSLKFSFQLAIVYPVIFKMNQFVIFTSQIPRIHNEYHIITDCVLIDTLFKLQKYYRFTQSFTNFVTHNPAPKNMVHV